MDWFFELRQLFKVFDDVRDIDLEQIGPAVYVIFESRIISKFEESVEERVKLIEYLNNWKLSNNPPDNGQGQENMGNVPSTSMHCRFSQNFWMIMKQIHFFIESISDIQLFLMTTKIKKT